jgi:PAS domain S-box-containing protein
MTVDGPPDPRASRPSSISAMGDRRPHVEAESGPGDSNGHPRPPQARDADADPPPAPPAHSAPARPTRDPVFIVGQEGEILFANCPLGDRSEDDLVGTVIYEWIRPEQHELVVQSLARVFGSSETQRFELAGFQYQQTDLWYDCRLTPNIREGSVVSVTFVAHEITQYKRSIVHLESASRDLRRLLEERTADFERAQASLAEEVSVREEREREWRRFRTLMDHAGEAVFVTDPRTEKIVDVNETAARWIGRSRTDAIGRRLHELRLEFPVLPPVELELEFTETRDTRRPLFLSGVHRRRDGTTFPVEVAVATHTVGEERYVLAVARDVKSRNAVEEELDESARRYETLFEQCWDAIYLTARDGHIEAVNGAAIELFGYDREEFPGLDGRQLFAKPVDIRRFQVQMNTLGSVSDLEVEFLTRNGAVFRAILSAVRRPGRDDAIMGYQCMVRPLTLPEERPAPPPNAEPVPTHGAVIVAGTDAGLATVRDALRAAGLRVLTATSAAAAVDLLRLHGGAVTSAVIDADVGEIRGPLESFRRIAAQAELVLITRGDPVEVAEQVADLGIRAVLQKPVHPLALIQRIRDG